MTRLLGRLAYTAGVLCLGGHRVFAYLREARSVRRLPEHSLLDRQRERLGELLSWVRENNHFYGSLLAGTDPAIDPEAVLGRLPILERETLQDMPEALYSEGFRGRVVSKSTGGSTGEPVQIQKGVDGISREMAASWAALEQYGIRIGDRSVRFWGTPLTARRRFRFWLADVAMNRLRFSAFALDDDDFRRYWRRALRFRPAWIYGYGSVIHMFAKWIEVEGLDGTRLDLRAVVSTSEPLNNRQRNEIERVFGVGVYDEYGCGEVGAIAYGCGHGKLHVLTENVVVECVNEKGSPVSPGTLGRLVITDLANYAMPLLRYRVGDLGVLGRECECGTPGPFIDGIRGRIHDVVYTPAGRRWHGEKIDYLMSQLHQDLGGFRQYQVVQHRSDAIRISLVADQDISSDLKRRITSYVAHQLDGMQAEVHRVDAIERTASGKLRLVRNDWLPDSHQPHL